MQFSGSTLLGAALSAALLLPAARAGAQSTQSTCLTLRYQFQADCYRPDLGSACVQDVTHLDLGPQVAVWLEDANGNFVDTLMVTNSVANRGIGNRPGRWDFLSAPLFPYGKRQMALPIWAHARGYMYPTVMMMEPDGSCAVGGPAESCTGWHEAFSSTEGYFCRPLRPNEINLVDAVSCPTRFNSEKGKLDHTTPSYYPPRQDLTAFTGIDGPDPPTYTTMINPADPLDGISAATPAYGTPFMGNWMVPETLPPGDYVLMVEVNKEFDGNAAHMHPDYPDPHLPGYGIEGNFGQPSVVYRVPVHIDATTVGITAAASEIFGYGDWTGAVGDVTPKDATISTTQPGSGEMRLLERSVFGVTGRVHVSVDACVCSQPTGIADLSVADNGLQAESVTLSFTNASADGTSVPAYQVKYREGTSMTDADFSSATSGPQVIPGAPGTTNSVVISGLKPATQYTAGVRALGSCPEDVSPVATVSFKTPAKNFAKVEGCFIATAAWGSELEPEVAAMRRVRDRLRPASALFALATNLYYRSGPAAARVIRHSDSARAVVRRLLAPVAAVSSLATPIGD